MTPRVTDELVEVARTQMIRPDVGVAARSKPKPWAGYSALIDYGRQPPAPKLTEAELAWLDGMLQRRGTVVLLA